MSENQRDKRKVNPLSGAEDAEGTLPAPAKSATGSANATTTTIPGTGEVIRDLTGKEVKRVVST